MQAMSDKLRMDYINSLPQPFLARFCGDKSKWQVHDICVETGLIRIDVCGKLDIKHMGEVMEIWDCDGASHDPDDWYAEGTPP